MIADYPHHLSATAYCLRGVMSDGTYTRAHSAASNELRLGTRIRLRHGGPDGYRDFVIRDHIGYGTRLDLWTPSCSNAIRWGRRPVSFKIIHKRLQAQKGKGYGRVPQ